MDYDKGLSGKELIAATAKIVKSTLTTLKEDEIMSEVQEHYSDHEFFDGEPTDPTWFANKVIANINRKAAKKT